LYQSPMRLTKSLGLDAERVNESVMAARAISRLISALRRHSALFTGCCLAGVGLGTFYLITAVPLYTASAYIMIENRQVRALHDVSTFSDAPALDTAEIESHVEVLRSENVGLAVVRQLKLSDDPAFFDPPRLGKIWAAVMAPLGMKQLGMKTDAAESSNEADAALKRQMTALETLNSNLDISRVGRTFVLQVSYTAPNPVRAAEIVNGYANTYMLEQLNSRGEATHRARSWLQQRTEELRQLSVDSDLAAQKFRADHNLLATKGTLISEQQLNEMTTELVAARAATEETEARYLRIKNIIDTHQTESAVTESLANQVINDLRTKYLDASKRMSELELKLGPSHVAVVTLKHSLDELSRLLFQELGRVAETYRSDYEVAAAREKALADNLAQQRSIAVAANDAQVLLRQLEQKAESYKTLYQTYLQRYQEAAQQETFPMTDGRIISTANPPLSPSHPRKLTVLAMSLALGALAGVAAGQLRESMDRVFRTSEQVHDELDVEVLGILPILPSSSPPPSGTIKAAESKSNLAMGNQAPILRYAIDHPFSQYAEALRSAKIAADITLKDRSAKIIGVVSLLPGEGKTTVTKNFASLLALQGARTLLVDADTRNPGLTRGIGCESKKDTPCETSVPPQWAELLVSEPESGLQILPCLYAKDDHRVALGLSSATLQAFLQNLDQSYEYVMIDLPPVGPVVNARAIAAAVDAFIFVVAWGKTSRGAVRSVLAKEHSIREKLLGVFINQVDMDKLAAYEHFGSDGYYYRHYKKYYKARL
jgi:polysaccharide biosynthesis transport protein